MSLLDMKCLPIAIYTFIVHLKATISDNSQTDTYRAIHSHYIVTRFYLLSTINYIEIAVIQLVTNLKVVNITSSPILFKIKALRILLIVFFFL